MLDTLLHINEESTGEIDKTQIEPLFMVTISLYSSSITYIFIQLSTFYESGLWSNTFSHFVLNSFGIGPIYCR